MYFLDIDDFQIRNNLQMLCFQVFFTYVFYLQYLFADTLRSNIQKMVVIYFEKKVHYKHLVLRKSIFKSHICDCAKSRVVISSEGARITLRRMYADSTSCYKIGFACIYWGHRYHFNICLHDQKVILFLMSKSSIGLWIVFWL